MFPFVGIPGPHSLGINLPLILALYRQRHNLFRQNTWFQQELPSLHWFDDCYNSDSPEKWTYDVIYIQNRILSWSDMNIKLSWMLHGTLQLIYFFSNKRNSITEIHERKKEHNKEKKPSDIPDSIPGWDMLKKDHNLKWCVNNKQSVKESMQKNYAGDLSNCTDTLVQYFQYYSGVALALAVCYGCSKFNVYIPPKDLSTNLYAFEFFTIA